MLSTPVAPAISNSWVPSPEIQRRILERADEFQMRPGAALEALNLIQNPECSIRELVGIAHRDVRLTTDILRMANSALFGARSNISTLDQAVMRLGLPRCKNIILACVVSSMLKMPKVDEDGMAAKLWSHSLLTATIASHLNHDLGVGLVGEEYAAGLIHDLGRLLLRLAIPDAAREADSFDFDESFETLAAEYATLGTNHADAGAWFALDMRFPESLVASIRFHHNPVESGEHICLTSLVAAADHLANHLHRFGSMDAYVADENRAIELLEEHGVFDAKLKFQYIHAGIVNRALHESNAQD